MMIQIQKAITVKTDTNNIGRKNIGFGFIYLKKLNGDEEEGGNLLIKKFKEEFKTFIKK